jgi:hypothetical protein
VRNTVLAVALANAERDLLFAVLVLGEEHGADTDLTRPLLETLDAALAIDNRSVRETLIGGFFAESEVA